MPCALCPNPALCNPVCRAFEFAPDAVKAQMREACAASGQMTAAEVSAHVEAGEMPGDLSQKQEEFCDSHCCWSGHHPDCARATWEKAAPKGEAGEMEAAKGEATPLPTHPQQEKPQ